MKVSFLMLFFILVFVVMSQPITANDQASSSNDRSSPDYESREQIIDQSISSDNDIGTFLFRLYKNVFSKIDGSHCPMYPSCSRYGWGSLKKYGFKGFFLTTDRLNRCGHDLKNYDKTTVAGGSYYLDNIP